jgi:predicted N-acetyltransferase YhbS
MAEIAEAKSPKLSGPTPIKSAHDTSMFACSKPSLDIWLKRHALQNSENDFTKTFVVCRGKRVVGYYALASGAVDRGEATAMIAGARAPTIIPVIILARLAVDQSGQGNGIGQDLLSDALKRVANAARTVAARALVVHALDAEAATFYERLQFQKYKPDDPADLTYFMSLKAVRDAL